MKIAICFSGQLRTCKRTLDSLNKFIGNCKVDMFMHTWDVDVNAFMNDQSSTYTYPVTSANVDIIHTLNMKAVEIEEYIPYLKDTESMFNPHQTVILHLFYTWMKSIILMQKYEEDNNIKYDIVIKLRPDMIYKSNHHLIDYINAYSNLDNSNTFLADYAWKDENNQDTINDFVFVSSSDVMCKASIYWWSRYFHNIHNIDTKNNKLLIHSFFTSFLKDELNLNVRGFNDIPEINHPDCFTILRPECLYDPILEYDKCNEFDKIHYQPHYKNIELQYITQSELQRDIAHILNVRGYLAPDIMSKVR